MRWVIEAETSGVAYIRYDNITSFAMIDLLGLLDDREISNYENEYTLGGVLNTLIRLTFDIDEIPALNHPIVGVFMSGDVEISEQHIQFIMDAIKDCRDELYNRD